MTKIVPLISRMFISLIFVLSGAMKIFQYSAQVGYAKSMGLPAAELGIAVAAAVEILAGTAILVGFKTKIAAWVLVAFLVPVTLIFHTNFSDPNQMAHFLKNVAIIGGLLQLAYHGAGAFALDGALATEPSAARSRA